VALVQAVEQLIVIGSFALKKCCGWERNVAGGKEMRVNEKQWLA
jgi:hypothetical protein